MNEGRPISPNAFEADKPDTPARDAAEASIETLRQKGGIFVDAVRATRMPMVLTDPNLPGNPIVFANDAFLKLSGYTMDDVLGQQPHFMNGPGTDPKDASRFTEALRADQDDVIETVQYRKSGARFVATVLISAFKDDEGRVSNHFMSFLDVTRRVDAEEEVADLRDVQAALRESQDRQAFILQLTDAMRPLNDPLKVQEVATRMIGEHLDVDRVAYAEIDGDEMVVQHDFVRGVPSMVGRYPKDSFGQKISGAFARSGLVWAEDLQTSPELSDAERAAFASVSIAAYLGRTLYKEGKVAAALGLHHATARVWTEYELSLVEEVADRIWTAVERARAETALSDSEEQLSLVFKTLPIGVAVVDPSGATMRMNDEMRRFLPSGTIPSRDPKRMSRWTGLTPDGHIIEPKDYPGARAIRGEAVLPGIDMIYRQDDDTEIWTRVASVPMRDADANIIGAYIIVIDVDKSKRAETALAEELRDTKILQDLGARFVTEGENQTLYEEILTAAIEITRAKAGTVQLLDDETNELVILATRGFSKLTQDYFKRVDAGSSTSCGLALRTGERAYFTFDPQSEDPSIRRHVEDGVLSAQFSPLVSRSGKPIGMVSTHWGEPDHKLSERELRFIDLLARQAGDLLEQKASAESLRTSERHAQALLAELQHRVRNTLTVVRSIARRTADRSETIEEMTAHFEGRLNAFSRVQSAVARNPEAGLGLDMIIEDELISVAAREGEQFRLKGPAVSLRSRPAEAISLAIHELATNAVKYGALAAPHGRISVSWSVRAAEDGLKRLHLEWLETGLDTPPDATREGFGHEMLRRSLPYDLGAETDIQFTQDGMQFTMKLPLGPDVVNQDPS